MIATPLDNMTDADDAPTLLRVPYSGLSDLILWLVVPDPHDDSAGAWADLTRVDMAVAIGVAERLILQRIWWAETAYRRAASAQPSAGVRGEGTL